MSSGSDSRSPQNIEKITSALTGIQALLANLEALPRQKLLGVSLAVCAFVIAFLSIVLPADSTIAALVLDKSPHSLFPYPFTIQNAMYVCAALGLGDLYVRWNVAKKELAFADAGFLPEDDNSVIQPRELGAIRQAVAGKFDSENGFLPHLIDLCSLQFQASKSLDQTVSVLNSSLQLISHRVDLRYSTLRYIVWVIPTIGFIGTVVGISASLNLIQPGKVDLALITGSLGVAFYTTIVALFLSAVLVFLLHVVQKQEEMALNFAGDYCLKNLINRLYAGETSGR